MGGVRPEPGKRAVLIAGPTASGKSALALHLAERLDGVVINADSMQVYRELRILTARPTPEQEARRPHLLYGIVPVRQPFSVGQWLEAARAALDGAWASGRVPIVVGGTGLYFHALIHGLAEIPDIPASVRDATRAAIAALGPQGLHARLARRDPAEAARLRPGDSQRIARAWEVLEATGRPLRDWQTAGPAGALAKDAVRVAVVPPRPVLYARCNDRLGAMIAQGALDEVRLLAELNLPDHLPAMRALGVPHFLGHLRGDVPLEDALTAARTATRRYAKRQMTWLRHRMADWPVLGSPDPVVLVREAERHVLPAFDSGAGTS